MAGSSKDVRNGVEREKLRSGIKPKTQKRKRSDMEEPDEAAEGSGQGQKEDERRKKKIRGPKGPNPLSVKKPKRRRAEDVGEEDAASNHERRISSDPVATEELSGQTPKAKRKRKHKSSQAISGEVENKTMEED